MNALGKALVVVILVFSVMYMALAGMVFATHKNWVEIITDPKLNSQGVPVGLSPRLEYEKNRFENESAKFLALQKAVNEEKARLDTRLATLTTKLGELKGERDNLQTERDKLSEDARRLTAEVNIAQTELTDRLKETDKLRDEINTVREDRDELFTQVVATMDSLHTFEIELARVKDMNLRLSEQMAKARLVMATHGETENTPVDGIAPKVDGVIVAAREDGNVEISLGSDDGLIEGHELIVYREGAGSNRFVGKIEVIRTWPDRAVARVIPEFKKAPIERDDRVATRIN